MKNIILCFVFIIPFLTSAQCDVDGLVIDAILFDPNGANNFDTDQDGTPETDDEFVQICNTSASAIDLSTYQIGDDEGLSTLSGNLAAGECLTIVKNYDPGPVPSNFLILTIGSGLANGGEPLLLQRADGSAGCVVAVGGSDCADNDFPGVPCDDWPESDGIVSAGGELRPDITPADLDGSILPVELSSFSGNLSSSSVNLSWTTASEVNNDHFVVERSIDRKTFQEIGKVAGNGTTFSEQDYSFVDRTPANGISYYRLAQFDFNGEMELHNVIAVNNRTTSTSIYPTLTDGQINIKVQEPASIRIFTPSGIVVKAFKLEESKQVNIQDLPSGIYTLTSNSQGIIESYRFVRR